MVGRFVEEQDVISANQRTADLGALAFTERQRVPADGPVGTDSERVAQLRREPSRRNDQLLQLRRHGIALLAAQEEPPLAVHPAGLRPELPGRQFQQRGFPAAVEADDTGPAAGKYAGEIVEQHAGRRRITENKMRKREKRYRHNDFPK